MANKKNSGKARGTVYLVRIANVETDHPGETKTGSAWVIKSKGRRMLRAPYLTLT